MCFFKKKNKKVINSKYQVQDHVLFRYKGELKFGWIYKIYETDGHISYDIQVGGQCTSMIYDFKEEDIMGIKDQILNK